MCGIIALVRGPGARRLLPASDIVDRLDRIQRAVDGAARSDRRGRRGGDAAGRPRLGAPRPRRRGPARPRPGHGHPGRRGVRSGVGVVASRVEAHLDAPGAVAPDDLEAANAAVLALKDGVWAVARDRLPTAEAVRDLVGRRRVVVRHRGRHVDPAGALRPRPPRGARTRLRRASRSWCATTASTSPTPRSPGWWTPGRPTRCSGRSPSAPPRAT